MRLSTCILLSFVVSIAAADAACPNGYRVRKEARDLSRDEWNRFINAIKQLQQRPGKLFPDKTRYDEFAHLHVAEFDKIHTLDLKKPSPFLSWHRKFIYEFESALREVDPTITLPYWAEHADYMAPEKAFIYKSEFLGGSAPTSDLKAQCIKDGPFAGYSSPTYGCIKRGFGLDGKLNAGEIDQIDEKYREKLMKVRLVSGPEIQEALQKHKGNWDDASYWFEWVIHPIIHVFTGGSQGSMGERWSPLEVVFWLHHAYLDKIWQEYQKIQTAPRPYLDYPLYGFPGNLKARDVDSNEDQMCVRYADASILNPPVIPKAEAAFNSGSPTVTPVVVPVTTVGPNGQVQTFTQTRTLTLTAASQATGLPLKPGFLQPGNSLPGYIVNPLPPTDRAVPLAPPMMLKRMGVNPQLVSHAAADFKNISTTVKREISQGHYIPSFGTNTQTRKVLQKSYQDAIRSNTFKPVPVNYGAQSSQSNEYAKPASTKRRRGRCPPGYRHKRRSHDEF